MSNGKVFIIGLDGATFSYIFPLIKKGKLKNISKLIKNGVWGYLKTTIPPITGSAWPSFMTGKTPAKHGVFDFIQQNIKDDVNLVNSQSIDGETIFDIASRHGKKVISINVPVTYPPWKINGIMITGMLSPEKADICYPPEFRKELGEYRVDIKTSYKEGNEQELIDDLEFLLEERKTITKKLLSEKEWDLAMVVFRGTDLIPHYFRKYMDREHPSFVGGFSKYRNAIENMYEKTDKAVGEVLTVIPEDTRIFVMSDHGHGRLRKMINLNIWFLKNGFLKLKKSAKVSIKYNLFKLGLSPQNVYGMLSRFGIQNIIQNFSRQTRNKILNSMLSFTDVDWSKTKTYSLGHIGQIYVNLKGREVFGIVEKGREYENVRNEIINKLSDLKDPETGEYAIERVVKKEEIYEGPYLDRAPDLFVFTKNQEYDCFALMAQNTDIFCNHFKRQTGSHRLHGVFIAKGPDIKQGIEIKDSEIIDITPTVLYSMGLPLPDDLDGNILDDIFESGLLKQNPPVFEKAKTKEKHKSMSEKEQEEIRERLKDLGYLG
jgi:predicted AlkP superfamily phosphohydrolase/phosphomutase